MMLTRIAALLLALAVAVPAFAQTKQRIDKAADLPRFSYKIDGKVEDLVRDDAKFKPFAQALRRDVESVLTGYDISDKAALRQLLGVLVRLDWLEGKYDDALARAAQVRELEEKPADKLMSGQTIRAIVAAERKTGTRNSPAYRAEVARIVRTELDGMPYDVIENDAKQAKMSAELIGEALVLGNLRDVLQPTVDKAGSLSSDLAPGVVRAKFALAATLPIKDALIETYGAYLAAHKVDKPDIWTARSAQLKPGAAYKPVVIAVWDSGVDTALFGDRVVKVGGKPAVLAYDRFENPSQGELAPIPAELRSRVPQLKSRLKGFSDLQSNVDSPEATEVKRWLSTLKPDEYKGAIEEISLAGSYIHGTHVAGIAVEGNPYARILVARLEFDWHLIPDPCPSKELSEKAARKYPAFVDFMKKHDVRVVNMSWGGDVKDYEHALELCGVGKTPDERKTIAREYFETEKAALTKAFASAPEILFVAAAGNSNSDATFDESVPSSIALPNLLTVGAVDKSGDEAPFTSYGPTVAVHANGYQVESVIPGGEKLAESGTSMSSPQVANLAGKILAVNPALKPADVIAIIKSTAEKTADGRRVLVHPAKAVAAAESSRRS
jgi:subtilisin family serine protease